MKRIHLLLPVLILVALLAACAPQQTPAATLAPTAAPTTATPASRATTTAAPSKPAWQTQWEDIQAAAKREGRLVMVSSGSPVGRDALVKAMKGYGISAEISLGQVNDFLPKMKAERLAGMHLWDVHVGGYNPILTTAKPQGIVDYPLDPQFVLPEMTDPQVIQKTWYQGKFPWVDKDHSVYILGLQPRPPMVINTNLVKDGDIKSWKNVLDPKWKGKIIMSDPTIPGASQQWVGSVVKMMGEDFIKQLVATEPTLTRDLRQQLDWVAQGKMAIGLAPDGDTVTEYIRLGAPMKVVTPTEGGYMSGAATGVSMISQPAHPAVARFFLNWLATQEGSQVFCESGGYHALRLDVPPTYLKPTEQRQPGVNYVDASTEEFAQYRTTVTDKIAREEFAKLKK